MPTPQATSASLPIGTRLESDRFSITALLRTNSIGPLFSATDTQHGSEVSVQLVEPSFGSAESLVPSLQSKIAAGLFDNQNISKPLCAGVVDNQVYLVSEGSGGQSLKEFAQRKRASGGGFSLTQIENIGTDLCSAIEASKASGGHGAVSLESVIVNAQGRVQLSGQGLGIVAPALANALGSRLSPESRAGEPPSPAADVYGFGAIIYELLVGSPPDKGCPRPSEAVPGLSPLMDQFVAATMNPDPAQRPQAEKLAQALRKALAIDPTARRSGSQVAALPKRPSLAQAITAPQESAAPRHTGSHSATLTRALAETRERWLFSSGKLDYGPFSLAAIVEQIESGAILPGNLLIDNDTGERVNVETHPLLSQLVESAKQKRDDERRANAEVVHASQEKQRGLALYLIVATVVLGIAAGAVYMIKALSSDEGSEKSSIATLEEGAIEAKISFPTADQAKKRRKRHGGGKAGPKSPGGMAGGWDDTQTFDMAEGDVGSETLANSQVNPVIQRSGGKLGRCLRSTKTSDAFIEFMVKGTGKVFQVRVNGSTKTPVARCIRKAMMSMKFPTFDGTRSKHNFEMGF